jgi:hypothetical protein
MWHENVYQILSHQTFIFMTRLSSFRYCLLSVAMMLSASILRAQADVKVDVTKTSSSTWYTNPIIWIVGAALFILLLVALLRGGRKN